MADGADAPEALRLGPLEGSLGFLLRLAQLDAFAAFFAAFEDVDARPGELSVLLLIAENPGVRQGVLARALRIKRAHMTKMVRRLEGEGLLRKTVPEGDRRGVALDLTETGAAHVVALRPRLAAHEATARNGLTPAEAADLRRLLRRFANLPEGHP